jgi:uncharacterized protein with PQ loop repeat
MQNGYDHRRRWGGGISYLHLLCAQLKKCWQTGHAGDLSMTMFMVLAGGVALWIAYGFLKSDLVVVFAKAVSFFF